MRMMRTANPALNAKTFEGLRQKAGAEVMTIQGTVNKTALMLGILVLSAMYTWNKFYALGNPAAVQPYIWIGAIGGLVVALVTVFKKEYSPVTAPIYALFEGLMLGAISAIFESYYPGIVMQAVTLTFGTLFGLLLAYKTGIIRATENFRLGVAAATGGIFFIYLASFILGFFGINIPLIHSNGLMGIIFSLVVVVIAALNLVLDFDFIEKGAEHGAPKYMEWYAAFGLMVTLIWLYLEILRLLAKLNSRR